MHVPDELALAPLARSLVATLPQPAFVALHGDLGAGKTTFVKAIASAAGIDPATVVSPPPSPVPPTALSRTLLKLVDLL